MTRIVVIDDRTFIGKTFGIKCMSCRLFKKWLLELIRRADYFSSFILNIYSNFLHHKIYNFSYHGSDFESKQQTAANLVAITLFS